jgi:hypothetical protein
MKRTTSVALIAALSSFSYPASARMPSSVADLLIAQGDQAMKNGQCQPAISAYDRVYSDYASAAVAVRLAKAEHACGEVKRAIQRVQDVMQEKPEAGEVEEVSRARAEAPWLLAAWVRQEEQQRKPPALPVPEPTKGRGEWAIPIVLSIVSSATLAAAFGFAYDVSASGQAIDDLCPVSPCHADSSKLSDLEARNHRSIGLSIAAGVIGLATGGAGAAGFVSAARSRAAVTIAPVAGGFGAALAWRF